MSRSIFSSIMIITTILSCSCRREPNIKLETFLDKNQIGLYSSFGNILYSEMDSQTAINKTRKSFRVQNHNQTSYFHLDILDASSLKSKIEFRIDNKDQIKDLRLEIVKQDVSLLWLWDSSIGIGIIVNKKGELIN